ncbi:hypothetical protein A3F03_04300 [Candidatus Roizmanbacteria bacterium RIFCSPHIGHO2_12_FULL_41_11]|uniref:Uncharacterized protein n=3 Tax=Candidatus Roizmaniibacteriota TaxID=1752723 RepID=A0A1F7JS40_9BACT|nr:MAG: hypothetical protein A3F03_04300 [Candidatus Roizmanbacteria bacterium RIFCSPHIGHO2_12_FULL_41_11]OGK52803.1 MAG: hypothetical protein A2966_04840 [Candidatus Roizmanbacteria bacterium RIFCSPLOWO2_01_FULL_41_22]OGK58423.1 MAG: hypothetical protein A3H86_03600 [Candidatus Roizmanbacteria bacterium RIFCSPLOWO2_02_FULL_41_9]
MTLKSFITITPLSKILAAILFVALPFLGFYLGMDYQKRILQPSNVTDLSSLTLLSCDQLVKDLSKEYDNWNLSCDTDNDCRESGVKPCGCESVNTNTQKSKDIDEAIRFRGCIRPLLQCGLLECSCENKVCARTSTSSQPLSTPNLIDQALNKGEITKDQRLLYLAYAVYENKSLPVQFQNNIGWDGTSVVEEIKETAFSPKMCELNTKTQEELRRLLGGGENCNIQ